MSRLLFKFGLTGSIVTAICCFTPALSLMLGFLSLGALAGWIDYVLLPLLGIFMALTLIGYIRMRAT